MNKALVVGDRAFLALKSQQHNVDAPNDKPRSRCIYLNVYQVDGF